MSVNSALQRARSTIAAANITDTDPAQPMDEEQQELLSRYVDAFERYDMESLTSLIHEDVTQSMPPYAMWLSGRDQILAFWQGQGAGCDGSRLVPTVANGRPAFGQYKPSETGSGHDPWALQILDIRDGRTRRAQLLPRHRGPVPGVRAAAAPRSRPIRGIATLV